MAKTNGNLKIKNRKASYNYEFLEQEVAGISLIGSEVKSIRKGKVSIAESHCYINNGEVFITGMHIAENKESGRNNHDPYRKRKLLMTKRQINKWDGKLAKKGLTLVPVNLFITKKGLVKMTLALAKGKKKYDKKNTIKQRDIDRDASREISNF